MRRRMFLRLRLFPLLAGFALLAGACDVEITHTGDNEVDIHQSADSTTGQSLAGAQVGAFVGGGLFVVSNVTDGARADSGNADADNGASADVGPFGSAPFLGDALITHEGDNEFDLFQSADAETGDALAGVQLFGTVAGDTEIEATNNADDAHADSGSADASNSASGTVGPRAEAGFLGDAGIVHEGDNEADGHQSARSKSGTALSGGQVFGSAGGGQVRIVASNSSTNSRARSGKAKGSNSFRADVGPRGEGSGAFDPCEIIPCP